MLTNTDCGDNMKEIYHQHIFPLLHYLQPLSVFSARARKMYVVRDRLIDVTARAHGTTWSALSHLTPTYPVCILSLR